MSKTPSLKAMSDRSVISHFLTPTAGIGLQISGV